MVVKYVPILGPIVGSAFIIGLYMLSRLIKGDLTDRMKMMNQVRHGNLSSTACRLLLGPNESWNGVLAVCR